MRGNTAWKFLPLAKIINPVASHADALVGIGTFIVPAFKGPVMLLGILRASR